jgi:molybdopterin-guanine dinucleotide biosynthesis protein A
MFKAVDLSDAWGVNPQPPKGSKTYQSSCSAQPLFSCLSLTFGQKSLFQSMAKTGSKRKPTQQFNDSTVQPFNTLSVEICILAGGLSKRMGRDKSRLRFGPTTMLSHIRKAARASGLPVRVIRRDCIPKCGPLSGIYTALKTTKAAAILFLACDMPLVSTELIQFILQHAPKYSSKLSMESRLQPAIRSSHSRALFVRSRGRAGFPFILPRETVETVDRQIKMGDYSLQALAKSLRATILPLTRPLSKQLFNVNIPQDWTAVRSHLQRRSRAAGEPQ